MKNTKFFLFPAISLMLVALGVVTNVGSTSVFGRLNAEDNSIWNHYTAVNATLESSGVKEYWVNCTTHEHVFTKPDVDASRIVEKGAPTADFVKTLSASDDRYVARYLRGFNFDDGNNPYITIADRFSELTIVNGEGIDGSKALKASCTVGGDAHLKISKQWLDLIFADENVASLQFSAKGSHVTNNFRHKNVDASYVNGNGDIVSTYEINNNSWGIQTSYKQFYLTREVYSQMGTNDWFIQYGPGVSTFDLYLDNFKVSEKAYGKYEVEGFENGYWDAANKGVRLPDVRTGTCWQFKLDGGAYVADSFAYNYDMKSEGNRSVSFRKQNGYVAVFFPRQMYTNMPDEGILVDVYMSYDDVNTRWGATSTGFAANDNAAVGVELKHEVWQTIHLPKSRVGSDGRTFILSGSPAGTMYFDNIRYADKVVSSFEDSYAYKFGEYGYSSYYKLNSEADANVLRDRSKTYEFLVEWNRTESVAIVEEKATHGSYSLKVTLSANGGPLAVNPAYVAMMDDDSTLSLDFYTDNITWFNGNLNGKVKTGQWNTLTFTKADLLEVGGGNTNSGRFFSADFKKGTFYVDNIVFNY